MTAKYSTYIALQEREDDIGKFLSVQDCVHFDGTQSGTRDVDYDFTERRRDRGFEVDRRVLLRHDVSEFGQSLVEGVLLDREHHAPSLYVQLLLIVSRHDE